MTKNEIYTAMLLITILLISVLWKEEIHYRTNLSRIEYVIEKREEVGQDTIEWSEDLEVTTSDKEPKKTKPNPKAWVEKYGKYLHPQSNS